MSKLQQLSDVQVLLLAARFISDVNIESLQILAAERRDILSESVIYRLLLTLFPAEETARSALLTLLRSVHSNFGDISSLDGLVDTSAVASLSPDAAVLEAQHLLLSPFKSTSAIPSSNLFSNFFVSWAHYIETSGGPLEDVATLLQEFTNVEASLTNWAHTFLLPLIRLQYEYYPDDDDVPSLHELETISGLSGVRTLLQHAERRSGQAEIARDLEYVVSPWILGALEAHQTASWSDVHEWILLTSSSDFKLSAKAFLTWNGPQNAEMVSPDLAQVGFAIIYADKEAVKSNPETLRQIWTRSTALADCTVVEINDEEPDVGEEASSLANTSDVNLLKHSLLLKSNQLTRVSKPSSSLLAGLLKTGEILAAYKLDRTVSSLAKICLSHSAERQKHELGEILQQIPRLTTSEPDWRLVRRQLLWLRSWRPGRRMDISSTEHVAFLGHLSLQVVDAQLLDAILASEQYHAAKQIYLSSEQSSLSKSEVEKHVIGAIYTAYDNSTNGNRNRGGIKRASDLLAAFKSSFPHSADMKAIEHLLKATHSLSFYQLTLQHGVPFRPVNIRAQKDPLSLIEKVLEQDPVTYAKLDDLVEVGRNLVLSRPSATDGASVDSDLKIVDAEHRVTFLAISSALMNHDFNTAYSYITTRLLTAQRTELPVGAVDDTSWRAAYAAGRYRPPTSPNTLRAQISDLSKRMELLSLALSLAPTTESLAEILGTWRRCEEEMDSLKNSALQEERAFETGEDSNLPGGFGMDDRERDAAETKRALSRRNLAGGSATYEEEAPMGLFEMARGAANSLRKNAFPLNAAAGGHDLKVQSRSSQHLDEQSRLSHDGDRVRKRDMVGNMVTSGLVSGMGWVLGAQPTDKPGQQH